MTRANDSNWKDLNAKFNRKHVFFCVGEKLLLAYLSPIVARKTPKSRHPFRDGCQLPSTSTVNSPVNLNIIQIRIALQSDSDLYDIQIH